MITAKLAGLPAELAGYIRLLPRIGIIGTVWAEFQLGNGAANPIEGFGITNFGLSGIFIAVLLASDIWAMRAPDITVEIVRKP